MLDEQKPDFVKVLVGLAAIKPGGNMLTKESYEIWWSAMRDWPLEDFKSAASHLAKTSQFMPSPYQFTQLRKAGEATPSEAWTEAFEASREWRNPERLPNGRVARAARAVGGFRAIAFANTETEIPFMAKRFIQAYEELSDVESVREALPDLTLPHLTSKRNGFVAIGEIDGLNSRDP